MKEKYYETVFQNILRISAISIFLGRAWQFIRWDAPFRTLLWDESIMSGVVKFIGYDTWKSYATDSTVDQYIQNGITCIGYFFVLCAIVLIFYKFVYKVGRYIIYVGVFLLGVLFLLETKERFYEMGMFFEHSVQLMTPLFFLWSFDHTIKKSRLILYIKCTVALCFLCHALYALGIPYPRPGIFVDMTINTLHISEKGAVHFLNTAGVLDILAVIGLFFKKTERIALIYMIVWGLITSIDRTYAFYYPSLPMSDYLSQYLHTTVYRLAHGLVPLALYILIKGERKNKYSV